jgi:hypothetical protein
MRISLALIVFAISCGPVAPPEPTPEETEGPPAAEIAAPLPLGCSFSFKNPYATDTASGERLPANGGATDHASVVTVYVQVSSASQVVIRYDATAKSCATAAFKQAVIMDDVGPDSDGEAYSGLIPAFPANTHVCWKILAPACGVTTSTPVPSMPAFDYTTK